MFVSVPEIGVPVPLAFMPVRLTVLFLVQLKDVPEMPFGLDILI